MKHIECVLWSWLFCCFSISGDCGASEPANAIARDAQAAAEAAIFDWTAVPRAERRSWAVVRVTPAEGSGSFLVETERTAVAVRYREFDVRHGKWVLIGAWGEGAVRHAKSGTFGWEQPILDPIRRDGPEPMYSPTLAGDPSCCLVRFVERSEKGRELPDGKQEVRPWDRMILIPDAWAESFPQAWKRLAEVEPAFEGRKSEENSLRTLCTDSNGPLAAAAIRRSIALKRMDLELAAQISKQAKGIEAGVRMFLISSSVEPSQVDAYERLLTGAVSQANTLADAKGWGAGGLAAVNFAWRNREQRKLGKAVLAAARARAVALGADPVKERDFFEAIPATDIDFSFEDDLFKDLPPLD